MIIDSIKINQNYLLVSVLLTTIPCSSKMPKYSDKDIDPFPSLSTWYYQCKRFGLNQQLNWSLEKSIDNPQEFKDPQILDIWETVKFKYKIILKFYHFLNFQDLRILKSSKIKNMWYKSQESQHHHQRRRHHQPHCTHYHLIESKFPWLEMSFNQTIRLRLMCWEVGGG